MANVEQLFNTCLLDLNVPDGVVELPRPEYLEADSWLELLRGVGERKQVFFDEKLDFYLTIRLQDPCSKKSTDPPKPSALLLSFLNHLQVSLEASYISASPQEPTGNGRFRGPPIRSSSSGVTAKPQNLGVALHIFPPQTPSPMPSTSPTDQKYVYSEGALLKSFVWGEDATEKVDAFRLLWSSQEVCWIATYRLAIVVAFVRTNSVEPLLCLTTSITLRDKPLPATPQRQALMDLVGVAAPLPSLIELVGVNGAPGPIETSVVENTQDDSVWGEVNLLEKIAAGSARKDNLYLPSTRLSSSFRKAYSLPPISPISAAAPSPKSSRLPVLRKSFRKTLTTVSGFLVRMRTVFVPQIYTPDSEEEQEAANEERAVVLCVEIENSGESRAGFSVESVGVSIGGEGAKVRMIGWGEQGFSEPTKVFPLLIRSAEQFNLLYAVSFLRPAEWDLSRTTTHDSSGEFQRAVSLNVVGRPFFRLGEEHAPLSTSAPFSYPTSSFLSRWNCVLDLTPRHDRDSIQGLEFSSPASRNALPCPASPFPAPSARTQQAHDRASILSVPQLSAVAGSKRYDSTAARFDTQSIMNRHRSNLNYNGTSNPAKMSQLNPGMSLVLGGSNHVFGAMSPPLPPLPSAAQSPSAPATGNLGSAIPPTPAFPSYRGGPVTPRPDSVVPSFGQMGSIGLSVEARRDKLYWPGIPETPTPHLMAGERVTSATAGVTDFVVSVSLVPPQGSRTSLVDLRHIYPFDEFCLEIFVFNQSPYIRTLEANYFDNGRRRDTKRVSFPAASGHLWKSPSLAFTPLESKVRIGPLQPHTCQSVTMRFLAMVPGIHSIDGLTLTDQETGDSVTLRAVLNFAVLS